MVTKSAIILAVSPKDKAKTVPTFKLPLKGVIMLNIVQKGCTMMWTLHEYSASMETLSTILVQ
ncbi:hypothetical protein ACLK15_22595 [Escherichia coli]